MQYSLKDKIEINTEFLTELLSKSWQEADAIQQQITNINTTTALGAEVARLLKNTCTSYYVLIGCLEALLEDPETAEAGNIKQEEAGVQVAIANKPCNHEQEHTRVEPNKIYDASAETASEQEPFEYFVDFDEPSGPPITDDDLYN